MQKILLLILTLLFMGVNSVKAATIVVQNTNDSSTESLRQAVIDANDGDTIRFNSSLIASGSSTISLNSEIAFSKMLVFKGLYNNTDTLYISGSNTNRIFNINSVVKTVLDSMVFINGHTNTGNGGALSFSFSDTVYVLNSKISNSTAQNNGGGLYYSSSSTSSGFLKIRNCVINNNSTLTYGGGGISFSSSNDNNSLIIEKSIVKNNSAVHSGGAIAAGTYNTIGSLSIDSSEIYNNTSQGTGGGISIGSFQSNFSSVISNSIIHDNTASTAGGGIYSAPAGIGSVTLNKSTLSNNTAANAGGIRAGDFNMSQSILTLTHSTVSGNHATNDFGGIACLAQAVDFSSTNSTINENSTATSWGNCGGVYIFGYNSANIEFISSIVWTSVGDNIKHETVDGGGSIVISSDPINSGGYNIFSDAPNGATATGDLTFVLDVDLDLQPLADNGGATLTMQPGATSVAIDAGNLSDISDAQNSPIYGVRDIGAAEYVNNITLVSSIPVQGQGDVSSITTQGGTLQMEATVLPTNADDMTYTWSITNGTGSGSIDVNGLLTAVTNGTVDVVATANDGSGVTGAATITISNQSLSVNEIDFQTISIYPNPVKNELFIELNQLETTNISILDYSGRLVKSIPNNAINKIDVSDLKQGIYILKVSTENGISTNRFVK